MDPGDAPAPVEGSGDTAVEGGGGYRRWLLLALLATAGAVAGMLLAGRTTTEIGPFHVDVSLRASLSGDTRVELPPIGSLEIDTHDGLVGLTVRADELDPDATAAYAASPSELLEIQDDIVGEVRAAVRAVAARAAAGAIIGALLLTLLRFTTFASVGVALSATAIIAGVGVSTAALTWRPGAIAEPRYRGLLAAAPRAVGAAEDIQHRFDRYTEQLVGLVENAGALYRAVSTLETFAADDRTLRVLHVSDLHLNPQAFALIDQLVDQFAVDVVVDTGDIVDWGTTLETSYLEAIGRVEVPYVFVRGNHDSQATADAVRAQPNAIVLDGDAAEVEGLRLWGIGDPRFTPDKSSGGKEEQEDRVQALARSIPRRVPDDVDVVLVHDPAAADRLGGRVPLVLSGHVHRSQERVLRSTRGGTTLHLISGSTGGAGLRALKPGREPEPLTAAVLYFDRSARQLVAYDRIEIAGLGASDVRIQRQIPE